MIRAAVKDAPFENGNLDLEDIGVVAVLLVGVVAVPLQLALLVKILLPFTLFSAPLDIRLLGRGCCGCG